MYFVRVTNTQPYEDLPNILDYKEPVLPSPLMEIVRPTEIEEFLDLHHKEPETGPEETEMLRFKQALFRRSKMHAIRVCNRRYTKEDLIAQDDYIINNQGKLPPGQDKEINYA